MQRRVAIATAGTGAIVLVSGVFAAGALDRVPAAPATAGPAPAPVVVTALESIDQVIVVEVTEPAPVSDTAYLDPRAMVTTTVAPVPAAAAPPSGSTARTSATAPAASAPAAGATIATAAPTTATPITTAPAAAPASTVTTAATTAAPAAPATSAAPATTAPPATASPTTAAPVTTAAPATTAAPGTTLPAGARIPSDWPAGTPIPPIPPGCNKPVLEDNGVWNCDH